MFLYSKFFFSTLASFRIFSLFLIFCNFKVICLGVIFYMFIFVFFCFWIIQLSIFRTFWICCLVSDINRGNFQSLLFHIFLLFLFPFLLKFNWCLFYTFCSCLTVLGFFCSGFFFVVFALFVFNFGDFLFVCFCFF